MANANFQTNPSLQRHARTPYAKQNGSVLISYSGERRSSWQPTSSVSATNTGLNISAQQRAQLENIYRQSIGQSNPNGPNNKNNSAQQTGENFFGVQQLLIEFQKLCASTKEGSPVSASTSSYGFAYKKFSAHRKERI